MFYLMIDSGIPQINDIECLKKLHEQFAPGLTKDQAKNKFLKDFTSKAFSFSIYISTSST